MEFSRSKLPSGRSETEGSKNEARPTVISIDNAELGRLGASERIFRGDSRRAGPVSRLLVLGAGESHRAIVAVIPERWKLSYWQRVGRGSRRGRRDRRDLRG